MSKTHRNLMLASVACLSLLSAGCMTTGGYGQFYQPETFIEYPPTQNVRVYRFTQDGLQSLLREGCIVIGQSSFNGPLANQSQAIQQGKKVGAHIVLVDQRHTETRQGSLPMSQYHAPQTTTIRSSGHATGSAYGSGGYAYGSASSYGTSYVTTPGYTTTQYVPITVQRYDQLAIFLRQTSSESNLAKENSSTDLSPQTQNKTNAATLFDKAIRNLPPDESEEIDLLRRSDPRRKVLKKKAISTLSPLDQKVITDTEERLGFEF